MKLPEFGVKRPITNIMIFSTIIILSVYSLSRLGIDMMPEIEPPAISVLSPYPGANPEDVEIKVTETLENQLATTPGLEKITSRSMEGFSIITLKFKWGTNLDEATNDIRDRIDRAKRFLPDIPDEMDNPYIFKFNTSMIPILFMGITARESYSDLYDMIDKRVGDSLKQLPGVGTVDLIGGLQRQINIWIDRESLDGYNFSVQDIESALKKANITQPVGSIKSGLTDYLLRLPGEFATPDEINLVILGKRDNKIVYLKDVARVEDSYKEVTMNVKINKDRGLLLMVQKQTGTNTVEVAERLKKKLAEIEKTLPPDITIYPIFDSSKDIVTSLDSLKSSLWISIILVVLVVWFFLRQWQPSVIVALTIPFSLLIAFVYIFFSGKTINTISLSSLAIAVGMVVDDAIVVVDNVYRHLEKGQRPAEAAIHGTSEMALAIVASTTTTVVVFMPMLFISGVVGIMFGELSVIVTVTLLASLFTAMTFTPMICSKLMKKPVTDGDSVARSGALQKFYKASEKWFTAIEDKYSQALTWCLGHKKTVIYGFLSAFIISVFLMRFVGNEFMPEEDTGDLRLTIELPQGTRLEETQKVADRIEAMSLKDIPEITQMYVQCGEASGMGKGMGGASGKNVVATGIKLAPKDKRTRSVFEIAQEMRKKIDLVPGIMKVDMQAGSPMGRMITGMGGKSVQIEIVGHSFAETDSVAAEIKEIVEKVPGTVDVSVSRQSDRPEIEIEVDREKASSLGLDMELIASSVKTFIEGSIATKYREKGKTYDIYVWLEEASRSKIEDVESLTLVSPVTGKQIKLGNIATLKETLGPVEIERLNRERVVKVECNIYKRSPGKVREDIQKGLRNIVIPSDIMLNFGGEAEEQVKAFKDLLLLLILGMILVYAVMAAQFESLLDPFIIMFSVPFTFTGVVISFLLTGTSLSVITFLGIIMLVGIVVHNAIVLISYIIILRARGLELMEAITSAGKHRLRPVLMTTITTLVGWLPLALSSGEGSEIWQPLGITMFGGLTVSTIITLLFVPTLYAIVELRVKGRDPLKKRRIAQ